MQPHKSHSRTSRVMHKVAARFHAGSNFFGPERHHSAQLWRPLTSFRAAERYTEALA